MCTSLCFTCDWFQWDLIDRFVGFCVRVCLLKWEFDKEIINQSRLVDKTC